MEKKGSVKKEEKKMDKDTLFILEGGRWKEEKDEIFILKNHKRKII